MSVSSTTSKAGPFSCNSVQTVFPFAFKVFSKNDVRVVLTDALGVEVDLVVDTNYTVSLNVDQNTNPGGNITTLLTYTTGNLITAVGNLSPTQLLSISNFRPDVIEKAFDKLTLLVQQLFEQCSRAVKTSVSDTTAPNIWIQTILDAAASAVASAASALGYKDLAETAKNAAAVSASIIAGFEWKGSWAGTTVYVKNNLVYDSGNSYIALSNHTSSVLFSTDYSGGKWALFTAKGAAGAGTGDMLAANNLTDVASINTARSNLNAAKAGANTDITRLTAAAVTVAADDKVLIQDTSDSDDLKSVTVQSILDLAVAYKTIVQNAQNANYTLVLADAAKHIYSKNAGAQTLTIPLNAAVAFPVGTAITLINNGTTAITFSTTGLTVYKAGVSAAWASGGTLGIRGEVTLLKVETDTWFISGSGLS